ncbi:MAG: ABC transporter permease, partial [Rhodoferax sp.]
MNAQTRRSHGTTAAVVALSALLAAALYTLPAAHGEAVPDQAFWAFLAALGGLALWSIRRVAAISGTRFDGVLTAALFGLWVLYFWQVLVVACEVPRVLLPAPTLIAQALLENGLKLWGDFEQTVLKAVLIGGATGSALGFAVAVAIDRSPFLQRGLLPLAALTSTV